MAKIEILYLLIKGRATLSEVAILLQDQPDKEQIIVLLKILGFITNKQLCTLDFENLLGSTCLTLSAPCAATSRPPLTAPPAACHS